MAEFPQFGKIGRQFFDEVIYPKLGARRAEVLVGPRHGCDNAVIGLNDEQVLIVTTDPLSIIPALGLQDSAWLTVHLLASDLATSGVAPQFAVFDFNLPPEISAKEFEAYATAIHNECEKLGIAIVAGHTGKFFGCNYTIVGGGMMMAIGHRDTYLAPTMAQPGDRVVITKGLAVAATGILARVFPETIRSSCGEEIHQRALSYFRKFSVVEDALTASSVGVRRNGVTAMHDATEGGLFGGLTEMAAAAECGFMIRRDAIPIPDEVRAVCDLFQIDPYVTLSEGTLLVTVVPEKVKTVMDALASKLIPAYEIGAVVPASEGLWLKDGAEKKPIAFDGVDPYWAAFAKALQEGGK
jgi:hydrogenase maturation factor